MAKSKLDQVEPITSRFNLDADSAIEKKLSQYNLNDSELEIVQKARAECRENTAREKAQMANPQERANRKEDAVRYLTENHGQLGARPQSPDDIPGYLTPKQIENQAARMVHNDHKARLKSFEAGRDATIKATLSQAASQGRGPQPEQERQEHNDRNLSETFERYR